MGRKKKEVIPEIKTLRPDLTLKIGSSYKIEGIGYSDSYGDGIGIRVNGIGTITNIYEDGRKCPYKTDIFKLHFRKDAFYLK